MGSRASSAGVRVHVAGNELDVARVGFALVGLRSSVRRNLLRRRLREAVRPLLASLAGHDVVIVAGSEALRSCVLAISDPPWRRPPPAPCNGRRVLRWPRRRTMG